MAKPKKGISLLIIGALGVVFGDIGTSPLYALQAIFGAQHLSITAPDVYGIISLIIWSITLVVSIKYVSLLMRASNSGEGGVMALVALARSTKLTQKKHMALILLGLAGVSLFYGDSVITPAISVLSAVEGISVVAPDLAHFIIPVTLIVLGLLFSIQAWGTAVIGRLFGPIMLVWFGTLALGGLHQILQHPDVLTALLPTTALEFIIRHPVQAFIAMGGVVLAITGAEALYADMGHFGRKPIARSWFLFVFPALSLNYMGQGALIVADPETIRSSFFLLFPGNLQLPVVILATIATFIASQAVISGAFSLTRQAVQLGFAPRLLIKHTSRAAIGQIYIPALNWLICAAVIILVLTFGSSHNLAGAYGVAVSGTLGIDTVLFLVIVRLVWKKSWPQVVSLGVLFLSIDLVFISSSLTKIPHGGWIPLTIGVAVFALLSTWTKGRSIIGRERHAMEGTLQTFVEALAHKKPAIPRLPGSAVYLGHHAGMAPLALHATLDQLHELHEKVVIATITTTHKPHVPEDERVVFDGLGYPNDGISHVTLRFGFMDTPNVPQALEAARSQSSELNFDPHTSAYFISLSKPVIAKNHHLARWRKILYILLSRNATSPSDYFKLPLDRTVEMSSYIKL
jgi:KUP system potassium uptake protein